MSRRNEQPTADIDEALAEWRQGDCSLETVWFLFRFDPTTPLTPEARTAAAEGLDAAESEERGFMVVTQTCDLVRSCESRPFVEIAPLVVVDEKVAHDVVRGRTPRFASVPGLRDRRLVADLDRIMTVEKAVIAHLERIRGCRDDHEARLLMLSLARKRARVAFPDDFVTLAQPLVKRLVGKHDKNSPEGAALRALREIRVRAAPSWDAADVEVMFWFIHDEDEPSFGGKPWSEHLRGWLDLVQPASRFTAIEGAAITLDDLTAREYVDSDPLDLEHLSRGK